MGEIAEMMLDGTLCAGCGEYLGESTDLPTYCADCAKDMKQDGRMVKGTGVGHGFYDLGKRPDPLKPKVKCKICGRRVKDIGLANHMKDAHGKPNEVQPQQGEQHE